MQVTITQYILIYVAFFICQIITLLLIIYFKKLKKFIMKIQFHEKILLFASIITIYLLSKVYNYDYIAKALIYIKKFEGLSLTKYKDIGLVDTICYGTTSSEIDLSNIKSLDFETCNILLSDKVHKIDTFLQNNWFYYKNLNNNQKSALISLSYNIGEYGFLNSTLKRTIESKLDNTKIKEQFLVWSFVNGKHIDALYSRREQEYNLFIS